MNCEQAMKTKKLKTNKGKAKFILVLILTFLLAAAGWGGFYFYYQAVNYVTTDNARITARLIYIHTPAPGILERFTLHRGRRVEENEVIGWLENAGPIRSPVEGLVVRTHAVENQVISPMEPVAVIADTGRIHIEANIEETDIMRIQRGQTAIVTIDALGNRQFTGYVSEIGRITQAELTGNALFFNTGGTFTRVTHLIPVEIVITDDVDLSHLIGVNARVRIRLN